MAVFWRDRKRDGGRSCFIGYTVAGRLIHEKIGHVLADTSAAKVRRLEEKATAHLHEQREKIGAGTWKHPKLAGAPKRRPLTFNELADLFLELYRSRAGNVAYYEQRATVWKEHFGKLDAQTITAADVERFKLKRAGEAEPSTVRKDLVSLSTCFDWAVRHGKLDSNPAGSKLVGRPRVERGRPNPLSEDDEAALMKAAVKWLRPMIAWGINSGMDRSEILSLTWKHVDRQKGVIVAPRAKTGTEREIQIQGPLARILADAERVRGLGTDRVFLADDAKPPGSDAVKSAMRRAWAKACPDKTRPWKSLRATFATRLNARGVTVPTIARLMGLTSAYVLDFYCKPGEDEMREAIASLDSPRNTPRNTEAKTGAQTA